jgi:chromate transporter
MSLRLCPDWPRKLLGAAAAAAVLLLTGASSQVAAIAACALAGVAIYRGGDAPRGPAPGGLTREHGWAAASLVLFALLFFLLPVLAGGSGARPLAEFAGFYRAGSLVFGGGHVVLPLLRSVVVPPGWISDDAFLAGYGAAQALPGPLFAFAGYLGTAIKGGANAWTGGLLCLSAIYLPAWLLVGGAYPFWHLLRDRGWARSALNGANASVVGILLAALYRPLCTESLGNAWDAAAVVVAIVLLGKLRIPPWALVALMAAVGEWILR